MYKKYSSNIYRGTVYNIPMCYKVFMLIYVSIQRVMLSVCLFQQMCLEQDQLLAVSSNVLFSPMDIKMDTTPLTGCVLSVRFVVYRISYLIIVDVGVCSLQHCVIEGLFFVIDMLDMKNIFCCEGMLYMAMLLLHLVFFLSF